MNDRSFRGATILLLLVAVAVRAVGLGRGEFWHDECGSLLMATWPDGVWTAAAAPSGTPDGGNPPFYYFLLALWTRLFGLSEPAGRSLSLILGVAQIAVLGRLGAALGLTRSACLIAMGLGAIGSLPVFYGTEARAYALLLLLLTIAMTGWADALRTGRRRGWIVHGAALLLAIYTHNLALPFIAAFWGATALRAPGRRAWGWMTGVHGALAGLYAPWIGVVIRQANGDAHGWIALYWSQLGQISWIPRSLEIFAVGGAIPEYLPLASPPAAIRALAIGVIVVAAIGVLRGAPGPKRPPTGARGPLLVFLVWPLLFLLLYSNLKAPLYLVGRYDLPAWPAFALLFGLGLDAMRRRAPAGLRRPIMVGLIGLGLGLGGTAHRKTLARPAFFAPPGTDSRAGEILERYASERDLVVCTGFTTSRIWLQVIRRSLEIEVATFPGSLRDHVGWYDPKADLVGGSETLRADAEAILGRLEEDRGAPRIWVFFHPEAKPGSPYGDTLAILFEAAGRPGVRPWFPPGTNAEWRRLGVVALERAPAK